ncbi:septal ring lytic transglycosylase RlpA family protein [Paraburkholderia kirstenboschensis]|uniref:Endolytic peptidoglycan transglycosylase RlpA n=1 Tax=Paraburkholderia kirstenboschensis TaxID=1245436 RepID=A0ABZ0EFP6_9BURK|nr:septal ring lytic transglycosylase RlpA family protein [Paraburkholderia kirstenboschensis]WOD16036.1 septal ring lytic transglycosylase RlpA family protein [Paraburkholderia kirstenboschensis]
MTFRFTNRTGFTGFLRLAAKNPLGVMLASLGCAWALAGCAPPVVEHAALTSGKPAIRTVERTAPHALQDRYNDGDERGAALAPSLSAEQPRSQAQSADDDSPAVPACACSRRFLQTGLASWYGKMFHGRRTASGERYNMHALTAAHLTLPLGACVRVTAVGRARSVVVRINDRGPFVHGRIIDLSYAAAEAIGVNVAGTLPVKLEYIAPARGVDGARRCVNRAA